MGQTALRATLPPCKVPRHIDVVDVLPRTATGKVVRGEPRALLAEDPRR